MADMVREPVAAITLADYLRRVDEEGPFEIINGEQVPMSPNILRHIVIAKRLYRALLAREEAGVGEVFSEAPFVLLDARQWVRNSRIPDLMFYRAERLAAYREEVPDWQDKPLVLVPDLAIEVVSPNDRYTDLSRKVAGYLADGVQMVWVVDPQTQQVSVQVAGSEQQTILSGEAALDGGAVVPGFALDLPDLFK